MSKLLIGKYVNTHGIKGEIRIKSTFEYKDKVFKIGNEIIIDKPYFIESYRVHKEYDMVILKGINSINEIPFKKNSNVYIEREKYLGHNDYIAEDLIGFRTLNSNFDLEVIGIRYLNNNKKLLDTGNKLIPIELIEDIDFSRKIIHIKEVIGL